MSNVLWNFITFTVRGDGEQEQKNISVKTEMGEQEPLDKTFTRLSDTHWVREFNEAPQTLVPVYAIEIWRLHSIDLPLDLSEISPEAKSHIDLAFGVPCCRWNGCSNIATTVFYGDTPLCAHHFQMTRKSLRCTVEECNQPSYYSSGLCSQHCNEKYAPICWGAGGCGCDGTMPCTEKYNG